MAECSGWKAWYNRMPGAGDPELRVTGTCEVESSSMRAPLELGDEGIIDEPDLIALELRLERPEVGDDRMSEIPVEWHGDVGPNIKRVRIQGDAQAEIEVREAV